MALKGNLSEVDAVEVMQLIGQSRKTGVLTVTDAQERWLIYFENGRLRHGVGGGASGEEAVYQVVGKTSGEFAFDASEVDCPETIHSDLDSVLLEGLRRLDTRQRIQQALPPLTVVPVRTGAVPRGDLEAELRGVLELVDGQRSIAEIVRMSGLGDETAALALAGLAETRLVTFPQQPMAMAPTTAEAGVPTGAPQTIEEYRQRLRRRSGLESAQEQLQAEHVYAIRERVAAL